MTGIARTWNRWFSFRDRSSDEFGIKLLSAFEYVKAASRGISSTAAGRSGTIWTPDGSNESISFKLRVHVPRTRIVEVKQWLSGSGWLVFSEIQGFAYRARCIQEIRFTRVSQGNISLYAGEIEFECDPWQYFYPQSSEIALSTAGTKIVNPGTAASQPVITIVGSGSFSLTIGIQTMWFTDVVDGIVIDSEAMDTLTLDGSAPLNAKVSGALFEIQPGENFATWTLEDGASITSAVILPRWRCM